MEIVITIITVISLFLIICYDEKIENMKNNKRRFEIYKELFEDSVQMILFPYV